MKKRMKLIASAALASNLLAAPMVSVMPVSAAQIINLSRAQGTTVTADCEDGALTADKAADGDTVQRSSRWSSKNIWIDEDPAEQNHETSHGHWIQFDFGRQAAVHSVKLYWERTNVKEYVLEGSNDGQNWNEIVHTHDIPSSTVETVEFEHSETIQYLRLRTIAMDTTDEHDPISPYYQNVSLYEIEIFGDAPASQIINLSLMKGVKASADCSTGTFAPELAIDNDRSYKSKWSSKNIWLDDDPAEQGHETCHGHWLQIEFPEAVTADSASIYWEKPNAIDYVLESSMDGTNWSEIRHFTEMPGPLPEGDLKSATEIYVDQQIEFDAPVTMKYIRIRTIAMRTDDEFNIYFPYHQNAAINEFCVYGEDPDFAISKALSEITVPEIITEADGSRHLGTPEVEEGYELAFAGSDYENVIADDGTIFDTLEDQTVNIGYTLTKGNRTLETGDMPITIPANLHTETASVNERPGVVPELREWKGLEGKTILSESSRIIIADASLASMAETFADDLQEITGFKAAIIEGNDDAAQPGDIVLSLDAQHNGLGKEGYFASVDDVITIEASETTGLYWGTVTLMQMAKLQGNAIDKGLIRDYPRYEVRGFGIDVGRQTVSLDMLKNIAKTMSWYKMNDLHIHLNDNEILGYSGKIDSVENALTAYSGFRLESSIENADGVKLTSEDMYYTKEDFRAFIQDSRSIGINVVPEIDAPAHSLAFTKVFPEYAFKSDPSHVDQIDFSQPGALEMMKSVYQEYIEGDDPVFDEQTTVHVGMDEYFGNGNDYRNYGNTLIDMMNGRTVRMWGSFSNIKGSVQVPSENVQLNIWHTMWANPADMYDQGYGLINSQNRCMYVIPGGGWDYLDNQQIYDEWTPNIFVDSQNSNKTYEIPSYSDQMLGGSYTMWHDLTGSIDYGLTEYDDFARFLTPLALVSEKTWATGTEKSLEEIETQGNALSLAPGSNPYNHVESKTETIAHYDFEETTPKDASGNAYHAKSSNAAITEGKRDQAADLSGNKVIDLPLDKIGPDYSASFWVYRNPDSSDNEQILFETEVPEGRENSKEKFHSYQIKAVQKGSGCVGISRENYDLSFNYTLPKGEWVYLTIEGEQDITRLYVNGTLQDTLGSHETWTTYATSPFPAGQIGHAIHGFEGKIDKLTITDGTSPFASDFAALDQAIAAAKSQSVEGWSEAVKAALNTAVEAGMAIRTSNDPDVLQKEADAAAAAIEDALEAPYANVNKTLLAYTVSYAQSARENGALEGVNEIVRALFEERLAKAQAVLADEHVLQQEVNTAWKELSEAVQMLNFKSDKAELNALIAQAEAIDLTNYQEQGKDEFAAALAYAKDVAANPAALTEQSIAAAIARLQAAMESLTANEIDTTMLEFIIKQAQALDLDQFIQSGQPEFLQALDQANAALAAKESQAAVDQAAIDLNQALLNLRRKPNEEDLKALQAFAKELEAVDLSQYDAKTAKAIREYGKTIQTVLEMNEPSAEDVLKGLDAMKEAKILLASKTAKSNAAANCTAGSSKSVKTAAASGFAATAASLLASGLVLAFLKKKRK